MVGETVRSIVNGVICVSGLMMLCTGAAHADRRNPAPIVYGESGNARTSQATQVDSTTAVPRVVGDDASSQRIEFRYPKAPGRDAPVVADKRYAAIPSIDLSQTAARPVVDDAMDEPAVKINRVPEGPIRVSAARPETPSPVGKPLTLSRVSANRDAPIGEETGRAGLYTDGFDGHPTTNGEIFDSNAMTAAHPSLPLPSLVQVTNIDTGREIVVRVNDRGPFAGGRVIDLTERAGRMIGIENGQTANVRLRYLGPAPVKQVNAVSNSVPVREEPLAPVIAERPPERVAYAATRPVVSSPRPARPTDLAGDSEAQVFIQAGSFADIGNAQRLSDALGRRLPVEIQQARVRDADYFRVMIGPFSTRREAETYRDHLSQAGIVNGLIIEK